MNDICIEKDIVTDEYDAPKGVGFYITTVILVLACAGLSLLLSLIHIPSPRD